MRKNEISQEVAKSQVGSVAHFDDERVTPARYALASLAVRHGRGQVDGGMPLLHHRTFHYGNRRNERQDRCFGTGCRSSFANTEAASERQRSGKARKKADSTLRKYAASALRLHSFKTIQRACQTCCRSVCFAQSSAMLASFLASARPNADWIVLLSCLMRPFVSLELKISLRRG